MIVANPYFTIVSGNTVQSAEQADELVVVVVVVEVAVAHKPPLFTTARYC